MSAEIAEMSAPIELHEVYEEEQEQQEEGPFYYCAYCNEDRGHDSMEQMCADCFWEYDSLCKRPGRTLNSMWRGEKTEEQLNEMKEWLKEDKRRLAEFREKLEAGQERIHRELEIYEVYGAEDFGASESKQPVEPKPLEEMTPGEIQDRLFELDQQRKQIRYQARARDFTPEESAKYSQLEQEIQALVEEYERRV